MRLAQGLHEVGMRFHEVDMRLAQGWHKVGLRLA